MELSRIARCNEGKGFEIENSNGTRIAIRETKTGIALEVTGDIEVTVRGSISIVSKHFFLDTVLEKGKVFLNSLLSRQVRRTGKAKAQRRVWALQAKNRRSEIPMTKHEGEGVHSHAEVSE